VAAVVPARGRGAGKPGVRGGAEPHNGRSRFLARRGDSVLDHGDAGDFRDRAGRSQELASAVLSSIVLETIPVLGSGKTNYVALAKALSDIGA